MFSPVRILEFVAFLDLLAAGLIVPQLPPQARSLGCNQILIGLMGSLYSGLQLVSSPMTGSLSDLKGRLPILLICLSLSGVAYTLLGVTSSIAMFLALRVFLGITKHTQLLTKALAPDYVENKNQLSEVYGRLNTLKQAGMSLGPIISGHIVEKFPENGFTIVAFLVGAIFAINLGLVRKLPKVKEPKKTSKDQPEITPTLINTVTSNFKESIEQFYKINWNKYWEIFSFKLFLSLCFGVYITNYVLFLKIKHNASPITAGYIISLFGVVGSLTSFFIGRINKFYEDDRDYTKRNLHVFVIVTASLIGVSVAPDVSAYALFIIPLGVATSMGSLVTQEVIMHKSDKSERGAVLGVANNVRSLSGVITPLLSGVAAHFIGVLNVVYIAICLAAVGTYKSYVVRQKSLETKAK